MLYLLEIFNSQHIAIELNLICQFDDQNYFEAIFNGFNQYRFVKVLPSVGNIYRRQIKFNRHLQSIEYYLKDLNTNNQEKFIFKLMNLDFSYKFDKFFTGIEWWNKLYNSPYPIRFKVEISNLMYGSNDDPRNPDSIVFYPVNSLYPNKDENYFRYPIRFKSNTPLNDCFSYDVDSGTCSNGLLLKSIRECH